MASLNPLTRELVFKIVFYGPGLGGKTTTLQYIHATTKPEHRGKMVSLATPMDRTLYFDFLPLRIPRVRGMGVRLQLFTVPGQVYYGATRKLVLTGADGVVFVADSQRGRHDANTESLEDLVANLADHNRALPAVPHTFHWNKRDLGDLEPEEELNRKYNPEGAPSLGTVATSGDGVFQGLERITRLVVRAYEAELPKGERPLETRHDSSDEIGIADAIRGLAESSERRSVTPVHGMPAVTVKPPSMDRPPVHDSPKDLGQRRPEKPALDELVPESDIEEAPETPVPQTRVPSGDEALKATVPRTADVAISRFSLAELWPEAERDAAREAEDALAVRDLERAVLACEVLLTRVFASAAALAGTADAPRDPGLVALLLGLPGRRYLAFRAIVRAAREGQELGIRDALECYALALDARRAREVIGR